MKNYNAKKISGRTKDFSKKKGKDLGKPSMHHATCNNCGKDCEVPFKPSSGKPIYCSNCFEKSQNEGQKKIGKKRSDRKFKGGDSRKRSFDGRDSVLYDAVCDNCGIDCEVPFRPTKGKTIYCDKCFGITKEKDANQSQKEFEILNKKLDKILEILTSDPAIKNYPEELDEITAEPKLKKKTIKRMVIKKRK